MNRILVSGGSGYVGRAVVEALLAEGYALNIIGRKPIALPAGDVRFFQIAGVGRDTDWDPALKGCSRVIHLAGQTPNAGLPEQSLVDVNDCGTARLVNCVLKSEAEQLILASSVAAVGGTHGDTILNEETPPNPITVYGRSKLAAEKHVEALAKSGRSGIALRLPSIYGSSAGGYWRKILGLAVSGLPLPFGSVHNRRTMLSIGNVESCLQRLVRLPVMPEQSGAYFVADGTSVGLREILTWLREGMGRAPRLVPVPPGLLAGLLSVLGQGQLSGSLLGNLEIDCRKFESTFDWKPPYNPRDSFVLAGAEYLRGKASQPSGSL